jgi:hypothetical protein
VKGRRRSRRGIVRLSMAAGSLSGRGGRRRDALIATLLRRVEQLEAGVKELEARLGRNARSSTPGCNDDGNNDNERRRVALRKQPVGEKKP